MENMYEVKRTRVQLSEIELKALIHHLDMEIDSIKEVYNDLKNTEGEDSQETHQTFLELTTAFNLKNKLTKTLNKLN